MAQYNFKDQKGLHQGTFYWYDSNKDEVSVFEVIFNFGEGDYNAQSVTNRWNYHYLSKGDKVFTTREEAEQYGIKVKADKKKEEEKRAEQKKTHDEMVEAYFNKKGRLKADDFVRMIKEYFHSQNTYTYIARKLRPEHEPFEYYHRAFAMLRNGYVDYKKGRDITGRCYFKNVDYAEAEKTGRRDKKGNPEYRITLYKDGEALFSSIDPDIVIPLRMIFTSYGYNNDWYNSGWKNNAEMMNELPEDK